MALTVVTYGGGEVLSNIFNAIAIAMNDHGSVIRPLMIVTASIGGLVALSRAFFTSSIQPLLNGFMLPVLVVFGLLVSLTDTVKIEDVLQDRSYTVSHVPLLLGRFAEFASSIGYRLAVGFEKVMHKPDDPSYNKAGMIFAADTSLDIDRMQIRDSNLEQNLARFGRQCVLYDTALGRYSLDELKKTTDLWRFLEDRTSNVRMVEYGAPGEGSDKQETQLLTCKEAMRQMRPLFEREKKFQGTQELAKHLPFTFQALTKIQQSAGNLIGQQLMMQVLSKEFNAERFATSRALVQQRSTYVVMGAMASKTLLVMRIVFEALIYSSFLIVIPLVLLPGGIRVLKSWSWLVIWIQLWPPFYCVLNYVMQIVAQSWSAPIFEGLDDGFRGLSFFTSAGLRNLHQDIYALAGYLSASIPFLSWAIVKGGEMGFMHLAGSSMTPAHSAAGAAASEQATGNYSMANASFGQTSFGNTTAGQRSLAPSLSSGYFADNRGSSSVVHGTDENILRQSTSELRTSLFGDHTTSESAQQAYNQAQSISEQDQQAYSESVSSHGRRFAEFAEHLSSSANASQGISSRDGLDLSQSARYCQNVASQWGEQYGLSNRESLEVLAAAGTSGGVGINLGFIRAGGSIDHKLSSNAGVSRDEVLSSAVNVAQSEDFQQHYQAVQGSTKSESFTTGSDEGARLAQSMSHSLDQVEQAQRAHNISRATTEQLSTAMTASDQHSLQVRDALNQDFVNWASETHSSRGGFSWVADTLRQGSAAEKHELVSDFVAHLNQGGSRNQLPPSEDLSDRFQSLQVEGINHSRAAKRISDISGQAISHGLHAGVGRRQEGELLSQHSKLKASYGDAVPGARATIKGQGARLEDRFEARNSRSDIGRLFKGPGKPSAVVGSWQFSDPPMWLEE